MVGTAYSLAHTNGDRECVNTVCLSFSIEFSQFCQSCQSVSL